MTRRQANQEYFDYLEDLRESGATNMFGAGPYLMRKFGGIEKKHTVYYQIG